MNLGYQPVTSEQCLGCRERPNERHTIYRFSESRFAEVRKKLNVDSCLGCHTEHEDFRISVSETNCINCHGDLALKNDPIEGKHSQLVKDEAWISCMGCHDFHGNHLHSVQESVVEAFDVDVIKSYFESGLVPYGSPKLYEALIGDLKINLAIRRVHDLKTLRNIFMPFAFNLFPECEMLFNNLIFKFRIGASNVYFTLARRQHRSALKILS